MDEKGDDEISIDFGKVKNFFKSGEKKEDTPVNNLNETAAKKDELNIDFSKFKKFFKSGEKEIKEHAHSPEAKTGEDELSFDFSKVKNFFKTGEKEQNKEDDISINFETLSGFFKKYGVIFIVLIPILLSIYIRMQAGALPFAGTWAASTVINDLRSQIASGVDQTYPNLPQANKNEIISTKLQEALNTNRRQIDQRILATSAYIKSFFQDEQGKNYMPDIDPYYWYRYSKNIIDHGYPGDILKDGMSYDNHQVAPIGRPVSGDTFHVYFLAYFYKFIHFFAPNLTLMRSMFYYPVFVSALCVLLVFLIARKIAGNTGGFFAGLMMATNFAFLGRTLFGHADSDAWVVFFPLVITWLFIEIIDVKSPLKTIIITLLAGFFTGVYTNAWTGWWYIFDFILATIGITFIYLILINFNSIRKNFISIFSNHQIKNLVIIGAVYFISTLFFVTLISGWGAFANSFLGPLSFSSIKAPTGASYWPNVLTTVAELNEGSVGQVINSVGGVFLFFIGLVGIILAVSIAEGSMLFDYIYIAASTIFYALLFFQLGQNSAPLYQSFSVNTLLILLVLPVILKMGISIAKKDHSHDYRMSILLALWFVSTIFASIKGIRFTLLLAPALSVAFGVALGKIYNFGTKFMSKELKVHKLIGGSILIILMMLVYINPIKGALSSAGSDLPIVNDAWYNSMAKIKQNSNETAIITSWWDFGHHFKALADRPVSFDGTTQAHPTAHWVGKLTMTNNERQAVGILRMLDCGSNKAFIELEKINNDTHLSLKIINEIILLDREKARKKILSYGLNEMQADTILKYSHCNPPEAFYIASNDMIGKSGVWAHFGSWNFERADIWQNIRSMRDEDAVSYMIKKFNYTKESAEDIYSQVQDINNEPNSNTRDSRANGWIAPWPGYGGVMSCSKNENETYSCSAVSVGKNQAGNDIAVNFQIDMKKYDIYANLQGNILKPNSAAFTTDDGMLKKDFNGTTIGLGMTVIPSGENDLKVVLSSRELVGSMFTRMFYTSGHGLKYFKPFGHERVFPGSSIETDVYTYKIDWEGNNATIVQDFVKKPKTQENATNMKEITIENKNISAVKGITKINSSNNS